MTIIFISYGKTFDPSISNNKQLEIQILNLSSGHPIEGTKIVSAKCHNYNLFTGNCDGGYSYYPDQYSDIQGLATIPINYTNIVTKEKIWSYDNSISTLFSLLENYSFTSKSSSTGFTIKMTPVSYIKVVIRRALSTIYADTIKLKKSVYLQNLPS